MLLGTMSNQNEIERLTPLQIEAEVKYRREERLGILAGTETPTPEQIAIADCEAEEWAAEVESFEINQGEGHWNAPFSRAPDSKAGLDTSKAPDHHNGSSPALGACEAA
jgi:hypothetical protein